MYTCYFAHTKANDLFSHQWPHSCITSVNLVQNSRNKLTNQLQNAWFLFRFNWFNAENLGVLGGGYKSQKCLTAVNIQNAEGRYSF